ncbi:uncharacterized protein LOC117508793 [Thalassophryne amazonica]|uniref:uncharacterized protein LOC117508793 n=1 Tax=Thalassophryne amazonica TaxID=390379 RepID=UPI001472250C|nr:uncharacterized protein LOC117508793 [Thalassophryne amazonica]
MTGQTSHQFKLVPMTLQKNQENPAWNTAMHKKTSPVPRKEYDDLNMRHHQLQEEYVNLQQDFGKLQTENQKLKEELERLTFSYANVKSNIAKLIFFTGLTSALFQWLLTIISDSVERVSQKISKEDHLLIVLMKLRLGLSNIDLAFRFNISKTTISNICTSWIPAMAIILKPLIKWPSKGAVLKNMPKIFKRNLKDVGAS